MPRKSHIKRRIIEGRCIDCGMFAEFGKIRCDSCLRKQNESAKLRYAKRRMKEKREKLMQANPFKFV